MRLITWNMGMARPARNAGAIHDQAWHHLLGLGPDIALVRESLPPAWVRTEGTLMQGPFKQWGSAVFSPRYPLQRVGLPEDSNLRRFGSYLAFATASLPDGSDVLVSSVHARDGEATPGQLGRLDSRTIKRPSLRKPRVNDAVFGGLVEMIDGPFILGGDWNTARTQSARRAGEEFFERVKEQGWWDCVYGGTGGKELQTWFGGRGGKLTQDDHVFCSKELGKRLRRAWVSTQACTELRLSDHAPLVIEFEVESVAMENLST